MLFKMRGVIFLIAALLIALVIMYPCPVYATDTLQVQKDIENHDIKVGDDVKILLKFTNPFGVELPLQIVDKNIFADNGVDIQCLEYTLPAQRDLTIAYDPIKPYNSGNYTLDAARITYTNPKTGKEETIKSNTLDVSVNDSVMVPGSAQGIITIDRCSNSNSGGPPATQPDEPDNQNKENPHEPKQPTPADKVQNNQMNQNTNALKQQINKHLQEQEQMKKEFQKNIAENKEFQKQHEDLLNSGYNATGASFSPSENNTGNFNLSYEKPDGKTASLTGEMKNGSMEKLMAQTAEDREDILEMLGKNREFQKYNEEFVGQGFNRGQPSLNQVSQNHTQIEIPYTNSNSTNNSAGNSTRERKITAQYVDGEIKNVRMEDENDDMKDNPDPWLIAAVILSLLIILVICRVFYSYLKKQGSKPRAPQAGIKIETVIDYLKETKKMIGEAQEMFENRCEKDAYEMVSRAVRFYFSHRLGVKKEMTNTELLTLLKKEGAGEGINMGEVRKCLNLCSLVEFARYKTNREDFDEIIGAARGIIV